MFHRNGIRVERCFLWPFSFSPGDDDITAAKSAGVLCSIVLDDTLKTKRPGGLVAVSSMAEE